MEAFQHACQQLDSPDEFPPGKLPFMHALDAMFFCKSCKDVLELPRVLTPCQHVFCYKCISSLINSKHAMQSKKMGHDANRCCPACKTPFETGQVQRSVLFDSVLLAYKKAREEATVLAKKAIAHGLCESSDSSGSSDSDESTDNDDDSSQGVQQAPGQMLHKRDDVVEVIEVHGNQSDAPARSDLSRPAYNSKSFTPAKLVELMLAQGLSFAKTLSKSNNLHRLQFYYERYRLEHNTALAAVRDKSGSNVAALDQSSYNKLCRDASTRIKQEFADFNSNAQAKTFKSNQTGEAALKELQKKGGSKFAENQKKLERIIRGSHSGEKDRSGAMSDSVHSSVPLSSSSRELGRTPSSATFFDSASSAVRRNWRTSWSSRLGKWFYYHVPSKTGQFEKPREFCESRDAGTQTVTPKSNSISNFSECVVILDDALAEDEIRGGTKDNDDGDDGAAGSGLSNKGVDEVANSSAEKQSKKLVHRHSPHGQKRKQGSDPVSEGNSNSSVSDVTKGGNSQTKKRKRKTTLPKSVVSEKKPSSSKTRNTTSSKYAKCPICNEEMHMRLLQRHVNDEHQDVLQ